MGFPPVPAELIVREVRVLRDEREQLRPVTCGALRYRLAEQRLVDGGGSYGYMGWEIGLDFVLLSL